MGNLIELNQLPLKQAHAVLEQVIDLDTRVFNYKSEAARESYHSGMRDLSSGEKLVALYEQDGEVVGFNFIKINRIEIEGRTVWAVGSNAGFLPGRTGGNRTIIDGIKAVLRRKLRHPLREFYFVSFIINPGGYNMLVDLCPPTYPSVSHPSPQGIEAKLLSTAAQVWHMTPAPSSSGLVYLAPKVPREPFVERRQSEHLRFYTSLNPRYADGELLGVCVPLRFSHLVSGAIRQAWRRSRGGRGQLQFKDRPARH